MSRRRVAHLLSVAAVLAGAGPVARASAATVPSAPSPLAFTRPGSCPNADEAARRTLQAGGARTMRALGRKGENGAFSATLLSYVLTSIPVGAVTVCDPAAGAARAAVAPFGGARLGDPGDDAVAPGLRALVAAPGSAASTLHPGDHLELPAVAAGALVDVSVDAGVAAAQLRFGPLAIAPSTLDVSGPSSAPVVRLTLADGSSLQRTAEAPNVADPALTVRANGRRLRLSGRAQPSAIVLADHPRARGADEFMPALDGATGANGKGSFSLRTNALDVGVRTVTVDAFDAVSEVATSWRCRLTWKRSVIASARCARRKAAPPSSTEAAPSFAASAERVRADRAATLRAPRGARAARATSTVAAKVTPVGRLSYEAIPEFGSDLSAVDLTGDGLPEVLSGGYAGEQRLLVSSPSGWRDADLRSTLGSSAALSDDTTGDGLGEIWTSDGHAINGAPAWSAAAAAPTIDLRSTASLGASDLALPLGVDGLEPLVPTPLPDGTGDGRPELLVGGMVFASETVPLGQTTTPPEAYAFVRADDFTYLERIADDPKGETLDDLVTRAVASSFSASRSPLFSVSGISQRSGNSVTTEATLATLGADSAWTERPTGTVRVPGTVIAAAGDAARGEVVLVTHGGCRKRRCLVRFLRVDRTGRILQTAALRGRDTDEPEVWFVADGSDQDDRPEVVIRAGADEGGPLQLWTSGAGSAKVSALPALASGGKAIEADSAVRAYLRGGAPGGLVVLDRRADGAGAQALSLVEPG